MHRRFNDSPWAGGNLFLVRRVGYCAFWKFEFGHNRFGKAGHICYGFISLKQIFHFKFMRLWSKTGGNIFDTFGFEKITNKQIVKFIPIFIWGAQRTGYIRWSIMKAPFCYWQVMCTCTKSGQIEFMAAFKINQIVFPVEWIFKFTIGWALTVIWNFFVPLLLKNIFTPLRKTWFEFGYINILGIPNRGKACVI